MIYNHEIDFSFGFWGYTVELDLDIWFRDILSTLVSTLIHSADGRRTNRRGKAEC